MIFSAKVHVDSWGKWRLTWTEMEAIRDTPKLHTITLWRCADADQYTASEARAEGALQLGVSIPTVLVYDPEWDMEELKRIHAAPLLEP